MGGQMKTPPGSIPKDTDSFFLQQPVVAKVKPTRKSTGESSVAAPRSHKKLPYAKTHALEKELFQRIAQSILERADKILKAIKKS
jgi:hypothetical protein